MPAGLNTVELIGFYGGDLTHACSAWTSTSRELTDEKRARMGALLTKLAQDGHHTPFEKSALHFLVTCDIVTHYQILKHRIGVSVNAESARYKELKDDKYYVPPDWDEDERNLLIQHLEVSLQKYHQCISRLVAKGVSRKRAKETARYYLPMSNQIDLDIMFNFRSFMHFVGLRLPEDAQREVSWLTSGMLKLVRETGAFDLSLKAFDL
jgi:thymidylate synthase (FAD)